MDGDQVHPMRPGPSTERRSARRWAMGPAVVLVLSIVMGLTFFQHLWGPAQPAVAFLFLLLAPGMAYIPLLRIEDLSAELILSLALSIALDTAVAEAALLTRHWSIDLCLTVLLCISLLGAFLQLFRIARPAQMAPSSYPG